MTKQEYRDYCERVATYLKGIEFVSTEDEAGFSWSRCQICNGLAGNRYNWQGILDNRPIRGTCCSDCLYYLNYDRLDDMTMLEIEKDDTAS